MYPAAFDYHRVGSVADAIKMLQENPEAKILAGGHSLLPMMKLRLAQPAALIDLNGIAELTGVTEEGDSIVVGAMTTYHDLMNSDVVKSKLPILVEAADKVGDVQVRNKGTIGGAIAHADPASDFPAVVLALDAEVTVIGPNGERTITAQDMFVDMFMTDLQPEEVVTKIRFKVPPGKSGATYQKFEHPASGYAIVGIAAAVTIGNDGKAEKVCVAVTGSTAVSSRLTAFEEALTGQELTEETVKGSADKAAEGLMFVGDIQASEEYREHLTKVYAARAVLKAAENAR